MERDLRLIRQKRVERDRANGIILDPSPPKEAEEIVVAEVETPGEIMLVDDPRDQAENVNPVTEPVADPSAQELEQTDEKAPEAASQVAVSANQGMPQDSADYVGLVITMPLEVNPKPQKQSKDPENKLTEPAAAVTAAATATATDVPLDMSEAVDIDFESMFNDTDIASADDALNFDFGLSTDPAMSQAILDDSNFDNINTSNAHNADLTNVSLNANEDIEGVLPGLENYLNAETDFSNISIPTAAALPQSSQGPALSTQQIPPTTRAPAQNPGDPPTAETSFDNFFGNFDMGATDDLGDGTLGDLDDFDWN